MPQRGPSMVIKLLLPNILKVPRHKLLPLNIHTKAHYAAQSPAQSRLACVRDHHAVPTTLAVPSMPWDHLPLCVATHEVGLVHCEQKTPQNLPIIRGLITGLAPRPTLHAIKHLVKARGRHGVNVAAPRPRQVQPCGVMLNGEMD
jgi:hypothetical protein